MKKNRKDWWNNAHSCKSKRSYFFRISWYSFADSEEVVSNAVGETNQRLPFAHINHKISLLSYKSILLCNNCNKIYARSSLNIFARALCFFLSLSFSTACAKSNGTVANNENNLDTCGFVWCRSPGASVSYSRLIVSVSSSLGCNSLEERLR